MTDDEIRTKLLELIKIVKEIIDVEKENETIRPGFGLFTQWKATDFNYDDNGIHLDLKGDNIEKPTWHSAMAKILNILEKNDKYHNISDFLKGQPEIKEHSPILWIFIQRIIYLYLEKGNLAESEINKHIDAFVLDLKNKPIKSGANVQLVGIVLHPDKIEITDGITLRKPTKEDFEIDIPVFGYGHFPHIPYPTAFLEISTETRSLREIQEYVNKAITILRLFKSGSVRFTKFRMNSDSILSDVRGTIGSGDISEVLYKYIIYDEDVDNLKKFWTGIFSILPPALYNFDTGNVDHISIAYDSYSDSLSQHGIVERRIANAIMGLEALYFKSKERSELSHRLSQRTAKLLSSFSNDPIPIRRVVKDAYEVRSTFLHGSRLNEDEKEKLLKHYNGNFDNLLQIVHDYLRKSLIIFMTVDMSKEYMISLLEDSLISKVAEDELKKKLESIKVNIN